MAPAGSRKPGPGSLAEDVLVGLAVPFVVPGLFGAPVLVGPALDGVLETVVLETVGPGAELAPVPALLAVVVSPGSLLVVEAVAGRVEELGGPAVVAVASVP